MGINSINTIQQAADWLSTNVIKNCSQQMVIEFVIQKGWELKECDKIKVLASIPEWVMPGEGELLNISPDGVISNQVITDGLVKVNDLLLQTILNHGTASLSICTGIIGAPRITINDLRILREDLERTAEFIRLTIEEDPILIKEFKSLYVPRTAISKLAIKAAKQLENNTHRRSTAKQVMELLQIWADAGSEPETLIRSEKTKHAVLWNTSDGISRSYSLQACEKTMNRYNKGRQ